MYTLDNFYQSKEWALLRLSVMNDRLTDDGQIICEHCGKPIVNSYDCIGHHKTYLTEQNVNDVMISLNPDNIALVHHVCHNQIHDKLGTIQRKIYLVYGSPLSGKSTWVKDNMGYGDIIVDVDSIWQCISGCDRYVKPVRLTPNMFAVRDLLIEQIRYRVGSWNNAYIVGGYPLIGERERICKTLGAEQIFIDTSKEECIARLNVCTDRKHSEWKKYIDDWWNKYARCPQGL